MNLIADLVVVNNKDKTVTLTWTASSSVSQYKVYKSACPYGTFTELAIVTTITTYTDTIDTIPINDWYYEVAEFDGTNVGPVPTYGQTYQNQVIFNTDPFTQASPNFYPSNVDMSFWFEEIRRRNLWILQNDGEDMLLYKKRYEGTKCPYITDDYAEQCPTPLKDPACYGTGFVGGYYEPITIKVRRHNAAAKVGLEDVGYRPDMQPRMWTIWAPQITTGDFLVTQENKRFEVLNVDYYTQRGLTFHQEFDVVLKMPNDMIYKVGV